MVEPELADDADRLSTLAHCFLAEGSGAGVGLIGAVRAMRLLAEDSSHVVSIGERASTNTASS